MLLQKSTASKQQEKADETKDRQTHTETQKRELERRQTTRVHRRRGRQAGRQAREMEGADSDSTVAAGRVTELCRRKAARERGSRRGRL